MNHLIDQLTILRLHGMACTAKDLLAQKPSLSIPEMLRQLIEAEILEREIRSIQRRMKIARFAHHKDFATFNYDVSPVDQAKIEQLATGEFTTKAHNLILVGGTGTGKIHIAIALGVAMIEKGKKVKFFNTLDLINALIKESNEGETGRIQKQLMVTDCVIFDELGYSHSTLFVFV